MHRAALLTLTLLLAQAGQARADGGYLSGGVFAGYALNNANGTGVGPGLNAYGVALGGRAGYTFGWGGYLGLGYAHHLGFSSTVTPEQLGLAFSTVTATTDQPAKEHLDPLQLELGYDLHLPFLAVRPYLGAGVTFYEATVGENGDIVQNSGKHPSFALGALAMRDLIGPLFVGLDLRLDYLPLVGDVFSVAPLGGSASAVGASLMVGAHL